MTTGPDGADVDRLVEENERLRAELEQAAGTRVSRRRIRRTVAAVLAFLTALLLVLGVVATWTSRTALDTDKFVARVGPVVEDPTVRAAVATELGDELVRVLDLQSRIAPALPDNLEFLAGPLASGAETVIRRQVTRFVDSDAFVTLWYASLRLAHTEVVKTLTGSSAPVQVVNGKVAVDLIPVIGQVLGTLEQQLPAIFGTAVSLQIPDNLPVDQIRALVQRFLGVDLPADFALLPVVDQSALDTARQGIRIVNVSVLLVLLGALVAFVLALFASVTRRRTLLQVGLWTAIITATVFFVLRTISNQVIASVQNGTLRPAITAGTRELFSSLRGWAVLLFVTGLVLAALMYLAGPGRFPVALRRWVVTGAGWTRDRARAIAADEGYAAWVARWLDPLRIGGVVVAAVLLLWLSSWTAMFVVGALLVLYEVGVTLYAGSTPAAVAAEEAALGGT